MNLLLGRCRLRLLFWIHDWTGNRINRSWTGNRAAWDAEMHRRFYREELRRFKRQLAWQDARKN